MVRRIRSLLGYIEERLDEPALGRGPEYQFHCPFCIDVIGDESSKRKLGINIVKARGGCYKCETGFRTWEQFFRRLNGGYLRIEEIQLLRFQPKIPRDGLVEATEKLLHPALEEETRMRLKARRLPYECDTFADMTSKVRASLRYRAPLGYLKRRGVTDWHIERYRIGYCAEGDLANYLVFPVFQGEKQVYYTTRFCGDSDRVPKSNNPKNEDGYFSTSSVLLNFDQCRGQERIALVEGAFDMMAFEYAAATLGKHMSDRQLDLFRVLVDEGLQEVVVARDPGAGKEMYADYKALLPIVPEVSVLALDAGDPWSRRDDLPDLLPGRGAPDAATLVQQLLGRG
jgi:hypothetical protein